MSLLFISYRRKDSGAFAESLHRALAGRLGKGKVVLDKASIPLGADFRDDTTRRIRDCDVVLAVIGAGWATAERDGERRLHQPDDPVVAELETALQANKHVIPVLVADAGMPVEKDLPPTLKTLAYKNALRFETAAGFDTDLERLLGAVRDYRRPKKTIRRLTRTVVGLAAACAALAAAAVGLWVANTAANSTPGTTANLGRHDPAVFAGAAPEDVRVARSFPDRTALDKATSLKDQFLVAGRSVDLFVFSGKALAESEAAMTEAAGRGVRVRVVLVDHGPGNHDNVARYLAMLEQSGRAPDWYQSNYQSTLGILRRAREAVDRTPGGVGRLAVRAFAGPFASSFWVRDAGVPGREAAHIAITLYGDDRKFPAVRFGHLSREVVENLSGQFEYLWVRSRDVSAG